MQPVAASSTPESNVKSQRAEKTGKPSSDTVDQEPIFTWRVHLLSEHSSKFYGVGIVALLAAAGALALFHNVLIALIAALLILVSVAEYLLPLTYTLDSEGAKVSCGPAEWLAMRWETVQSSYRTAYGMKLSPFKNPQKARMENCRGIRLRIPPDRFSEVSAIIASHLEGKA